jgi:hypothetical protein
MSNKISTAWLTAVVVLGWGSGFLSAQTPRFRLATGDTPIMTRANLKSEVLTTVAAGTVLEELDQQGEWHWVLLPPDSNGSRHAGWLFIPEVSGETTAKPSPHAETSQGKKSKKAKAQDPCRS